MSQTPSRHKTGSNVGEIHLSRPVAQKQLRHPESEPPGASKHDLCTKIHLKIILPVKKNSRKNHQFVDAFSENALESSKYNQIKHSRLIAGK